MAKFFRTLLKLSIFTLCAYLTIVLVQQSGIAGALSQAYGDLSRTLSLPSVSSLQSCAASSLSKAQSAMQETLSSLVSSKSKASSHSASSKKTDVPKTVNEVKKVSVSSSSATASKESSSLSGYRYSNLEVYEYGRTLLSKKEAACYDLIRKTVEECNTSHIKLPYSLTSSQTSKVLNYYLNDHPEVFYIKKTVIGSTSGSMSMQLDVLYYMNTSTDKVVEMSFGYTGSASKIDSQKKKLQEKVSSILSKLKSSMSQEEKLTVLYNAAIKQWSYSYEAVSDPSGHLSAYESYGALVNRSAVCAGYAKALKILMDTADLKSIVVTGDACSGKEWGGHAWNAVEVSGVWRYVDATFDDTLAGENKYLDESISDFLKDHRPYSCTSPGYDANYGTMPLSTE